MSAAPAASLSLGGNLALCTAVGLGTGWPLLLVLLNWGDEAYAPLSGYAVTLGWKACVAWLLTTVATVGAFSTIRQHTERHVDSVLVGLLTWMLAIFALMDFTFLGNSQAMLNRLGSDYQYTMAVVPASSTSYADMDFSTPHAWAPVISYIHLEYLDRLVEKPCVDVYLGSLGGYWAGKPYPCGAIPGRRMATRADLMQPAAPAPAKAAAPAPAR